MAKSSPMSRPETDVEKVHPFINSVALENPPIRTPAPDTAVSIHTIHLLDTLHTHTLPSATLAPPAGRGDAIFHPLDFLPGRFLIPALGFWQPIVRRSISIATFSLYVMYTSVRIMNVFIYQPHVHFGVI